MTESAINDPAVVCLPTFRMAPPTPSDRIVTQSVPVPVAIAPESALSTFSLKEKPRLRFRYNGDAFKERLFRKRSRDGDDEIDRPEPGRDRDGISRSERVA